MTQCIAIVERKLMVTIHVLYVYSLLQMMRIEMRGAVNHKRETSSQSFFSLHSVPWTPQSKDHCLIKVLEGLVALARMKSTFIWYMYLTR